MAGTRISALTDGSTAAATDRIPVARSPFGTSDNVYVTPAYIRTYALAQSNAWTSTNTYTVAPTPATNDACALGSASLSWADVFLASGGVVNWNNGDVTITHSTNALAFGGASSGYTFDAVVQPSANDGAALGAAATSWSDLFLASGGVINWANGNYTLTHSSGNLTASGALTMQGVVYADDSTSTSAPVYSFDGDANTGIGHPAADTVTVSTGGSERVRIDSSGNVGIGAMPEYPVDIYRASGDNTVSIRSGASGGCLLRLIGPDSTFAAYNAVISTDLGGQQHWSIGGDGAANTIKFFTNGSNERMRLTSAGELWVGYTSDNGAYLLQVNSQIFATSATVATSDARFKDNVADLANASEIVQKLRPVAFDWKEHKVHNFDTKRRQCGFLAQEVRDAVKNTDWGASLIAENSNDGEEFLGLAETKLLPVVVKALQEAMNRIAALEARLA